MRLIWNFSISANSFRKLQWTLDLRKISTCKFTYLRHFLANRFLDSVHKSVHDPRKEKLSCLNRDLPVMHILLNLLNALEAVGINYRGSPHFMISQFVIPAISWFCLRPRFMILKTVLGIHDPRISWLLFGTKNHEMRGPPVFFFNQKKITYIYIYLHRNVKYDAEVHMNLMNGFLSFWE